MDLFGICISEGYAAGNACMYQKPTSVGSGIFAGVQEELQRFDTAKRLAKQQLLEALRRLSDNQAASELIQVQEMLLDDTEFSQAVRDQIDSGHCAGQAVTQAAASLADFFRAMDDSYMAARASDFLDIANRLLDCMHENAGPAFSMERPCILVAEELLPSQTLSLDRSKLLGIVTATGSFQSHAAILARSMGIPAITGLDIATIDDGQMLLLDGCHGTLTIDPDPERYTKFCSEQKTISHIRLSCAAVHSTLQSALMASESKFVQILAFWMILQTTQYAVPTASAFSVVSFSIWPIRIIRMNRHSLKHTNMRCSGLRRNVSSFAPWTLARIKSTVFFFATGGQSGAWLSCASDLPGPPGYFPHTAAGAAARQQLRKSCNHDPDGL